jgi:hypothetical protein
MPRTDAGISPPGFESARGNRLDPEAQRRDGLEKLARAWSGTAEVVRQAALAWLVHPSITGEALADAWADYLAALLTADELEEYGVIQWGEEKPGLTDAERYEQAVANARGQVHAAMSRLISGARQAGTQ